MQFQDMGLRRELLRAIQDVNYTQPTPIQERAIPEALAGHDLMCCAQTGTGKTAAFSLPILERLGERRRDGIRALILVPTRELAMQGSKNLRDYGAHLDLVSTTVYGGVPIEPQEMMLRGGVDILVATPGRLIDHIWRANIDFRHTEYLVLDEADRMLDMGFIKDVTEIVELIPTQRQSMLFSATLDQGIQRLAKDILKDPVRIDVAPPSSTLEEVDQFVVRTSRAQKGSKLRELIHDHGMKRTIIFARTKVGASKLASGLRHRGHRASAIHSDRSQEERTRTLEQFREGRIHLLVATDIAARGLDIDAVSHVVNYDLPHSAKDYVHRIGRTARAGRRGMAISLVTPEDLPGVQAIERLISRKLSWMGEGDSPGYAKSTPARSTGIGERRRRTRSGNGGNGQRSPRRRPGRKSGEPVAARESDQRAAAQRSSSRCRRASRQKPREGRHSSAAQGSGQRRRPRKAAAARTEQRRRADSPAPSNGKKPVGVAKRILGGLKRGLFPGRR